VAFFLVTFSISCKTRETKEERALASRQVEFVIDWEPGIDYIGLYVAKGLDFYAKRNVQIRFTNVSGAPLSATLIGSGRSAIGTTTADQVILARTRSERQRTGEEASDLKLKAVATVFATNPVVIVSLETKPVKSLEDLAGKRLGMNAASVTFKQFQLVCKENKFPMERVKLVDIGWGGTVELLQGKIDALLAYTMERPVQVELEGRRVHRLWLRDLGVNVAGQVIAVNESWLNEPDKSALVKDVVEASMEGWAFARNNPEKALEVYLEQFPTTKKDYARAALARTLELLPPSLSPPYNDPALWAQTVQALLKMGEIKAGHKPEEFYADVQWWRLASE
jgi:NitT/TauT family transport system substrate-binding protein